MGTWAQTGFKLVSEGKLEQAFEVVLANHVFACEILFTML